ncbi:small acid-soluble spore protein SspI [Aquibacillus koreensis]|uniref:Small, acid-soluble spore protein I n=1 Tax=Aquibacillus koreensis TaxID=279446 RepID=A0A9X3WG51_9BACI|nr:small acid-soluble spore protein SspI [Aquibacillus koreensis]MCT2535062.1 small acid-soluble spore protein SspI [Aquibacillus koreensis]MDC3419217.1 small acid-soluble spore protein SspI [Aquibacillus koreensis]
MDLNLRKAILDNVSGNNADQLQETIVDAIENGEEKMLPGLGVLFELIWKESNETDRQEMLAALEKGVQQTS